MRSNEQSFSRRARELPVRELPPEISQRKLASIAGNTLNLRAHERELIQRALDRYKGNRRQAAAALRYQYRHALAEDEGVRIGRLSLMARNLP